VLPSYADGAMLLAQALRAGGQPGGAEETLLDLPPGHPYHLHALLLLGQALMDEGRRSDARTAFTRVLRFDPGRAEALFHLGVVAAAERRFREAARHSGRSGGGGTPATAS